MTSVTISKDYKHETLVYKECQLSHTSRNKSAISNCNGNCRNVVTMVECSSGDL